MPGAERAPRAVRALRPGQARLVLRFGHHAFRVQARIAFRVQGRGRRRLTARAGHAAGVRPGGGAVASSRRICA